MSQENVEVFRRLNAVTKTREGEAAAIRGNPLLPIPPYDEGDNKWGRVAQTTGPVAPRDTAPGASDTLAASSSPSRSLGASNQEVRT